MSWCMMLLALHVINQHIVLIISINETSSYKTWPHSAHVPWNHDSLAVHMMDGPHFDRVCTVFLQVLQFAPTV